MLVIPDNALEYPELESNSGPIPDNLEISDHPIARGLIRAFPLNYRQTRSLTRYAIDEGFEPEKRITRVNITQKRGRPYFDGSTSYVELMTPHHFREDTDTSLFTLSLRVNPDRQNQTEYIFGGNTAYVNIRLLSGVVQFLRQGQAVLAADSSTITAKQDHTITAVYDRLKTIDGTNAEFLYVDGRLVGTGTNTVAFSWFAVPFVLGRLSSGSTTSQFQGTIDNVLYWQRGLKALEIAELHRKPLVVYKPI